MTEIKLFDRKLISRYDVPGPRYTSYPTALQFTEEFTGDDYRACVKDSNSDPAPVPLSLYVHVPFCDTVCFYCACNKVVTKNRQHAVEYLQRLYKEIERQAELFDFDREVQQLHWGGGTPTFLSSDQMWELMKVLRDNFQFVDNDEGEFSIEVDPRSIDESAMAQLRDIGFNRVSFGVQDFDPVVQKAVNRIQSEEQTLQCIEAARNNRFRSVSIDLIYGLPHQTEQSFNKTLDKIIAAGPDRLSVFNYAHLPQRFKTQRQIEEKHLPPADEKLRILQSTIEKLTGAGYVYIGMDHFAKPEDELTLAQNNGTLHRNFQGYSTHGNCDIVGLGVSSIGMISDCYSQNTRDLQTYYDLIDLGDLAIVKGLKLIEDDLIRREVISSLICNFILDIEVIEDLYKIHFWDYFNQERGRLAVLREDGLLEFDDKYIKVNVSGRMLIRNICMVFDHYLVYDTLGGSYSKVI